MPEIKKFDAEKVSAAQKLLRALPEKDKRKSLNETLLSLSRGIQAAIAKGYSRREIRNQLAEAGVIISMTSLNNFLNGEKRTPKAPARQGLENMEASLKLAVNTKGMDGEQQKPTPENSNEQVEKQEQGKMSVGTAAI